MAAPSSKIASSLDRQYVNNSPMGQRLLQEDAIRPSGVSGPLGMGVVMQSKCCCGATPTIYVEQSCQRPGIRLSHTAVSQSHVAMLLVVTSSEVLLHYDHYSQGTYICGPLQSVEPSSCAFTTLA